MKSSRTWWPASGWPGSNSANRLSRVGLGLVALVFVLSRLIYFWVGVRFDTSPLGYFMQYPDPALLRSDLLRTSYYFHTTPPLYNVLLGVSLKLFGSGFGTALAVVYLLAGLVLAFSLYLLMRSLGAGALISVVLTSLLIASPATVLYENWLYPDYLIAASLPLAAWLLARAITRRHLPTLAAFFALLGLIVLARSFYHLGWLILCAALILLLARSWRRAVLVAAALPILLGVMLYAKNYVVFGFFGGASVSGFNAYTLTTFQLSDLERQQLRDQGKISSLSIDNDGWLGQRPQLLDPRTGVPTLDERSKSTGATNWNNAGYITVWNQFATDALGTVRARPDVVLRGMGMGLSILFIPSDQYDFSLANRARLQELERVTAVVLGQTERVDRPSLDPADYRPPRLGGRLGEVGWLIVAAYLLGLGYGGYRLLATLRDRARDAMAPVLSFILLTVGYIVTIDVLLGIADNNRYRFMADPLVVALLAAVLSRLAARMPNRLA